MGEKMLQCDHSQSKCQSYFSFFSLSESLVMRYLNNTPLFKINNDLFDTRAFLEKILANANQLMRRKETYWALCCEDIIHFSIGFFSLLLAKKIPVLLPNNLSETQKSLSLFFENSLTDDCHLSDDFFEINDQKESQAIDPKKLILDPKLKFILFTSGSTGTPKKIIRTLKEIEAEINVIYQTFFTEINKRIIYSSVMPKHAYGLTFSIFLPLISDTVVESKRIEYPEQLLAKLINASKPSLFISSPGLLNRWDLKISDKIRETAPLTILSAGGSLDSISAKQITELTQAKVIDIFGSSETGVIGYRNPDKTLYWTPFDRVVLSIKEDKKALVYSPFFDQGEENGFILSDEIKFDEKSGENGKNKINEFLLLARLDRIVKVESKRISLSELEQKLVELPLIEKAYCLLKESSNRQMIVAVIVLSKSGLLAFSKLGKNKINQMIRYDLAKYFDRIVLPRQFRYVKTIQLNAQGKVNLNEINQLFESKKVKE